MSSKEVLALCRVYFVNEVARIYKQGNKAYFNWVCRSVQEYIAISLFRIDFPSVSQHGKGYRQYISALIDQLSW